MPPYSKTVNERETRFVEEYLIDGNAAAAYVRAGYAPRHADINATNLMKRPSVIAALAAARAARSERTQIDADWVLIEAVALYVMAKAELNSKKTATMLDVAGRRLETVGKHVGVQAFKERIEHTGKDGSMLNITINLPPGSEYGLE